MHPEGGHCYVPRCAGDAYAGGCPFHASCVEGLSNAASVAARVGRPASELHLVADDDAVWDVVAEYHAQLCVSITTLLSPHVIVIGGGVLKRKCLYGKIRRAFLRLMNKYMRVPKLVDSVDSYIVASVFDNENRPNKLTTAGSVGSLTLAQAAFDKSVAPS
jgi:fructokinase